jgi:(1->4)-alpha-D-glucan 1-alpha-D-glucosylmutase
MARLVERVMDARRVPVATYRLQFGQGFGFRELADLIPYLHDLGVSDVYVSPFLHPTSDDSHGYDIADHGRLNAALGSDADYRALCLALRERGMGQIVDVVPNHMGIAGSRNAWWTDVLENGPASLYSGYFDIEWDPPEPALHQKVLLPILGDQYGNALENQELTLQCQGGGFAIRYFDTALPVAPETYAHVLDFRGRSSRRAWDRTTPTPWSSRASSLRSRTCPGAGKRIPSAGPCARASEW